MHAAWQSPKPADSGISFSRPLFSPYEVKYLCAYILTNIFRNILPKPWLKPLTTTVIFYPCLGQLELFISAGTVCMSLYSLVAAIFGMNIPYTWKAPGHEHVFKWVCMCTSLATIRERFSNPLSNFCHTKYVCCNRVFLILVFQFNFYNFRWWSLREWFVHPCFYP